MAVYLATLMVKGTLVYRMYYADKQNRGQRLEFFIQGEKLEERLIRLTNNLAVD